MSKGLAQIMKQAQMMQQKMARLQEEAAQKTASASAGGGAASSVEHGFRAAFQSLGVPRPNRIFRKSPGNHEFTLKDGLARKAGPNHFGSH